MELPIVNKQDFECVFARLGVNHHFSNENPKLFIPVVDHVITSRATLIAKLSIDVKF